jgi:pilus assembly protein FimV
MIPFKKQQLPALLLLPYLSNGSYALSIGEHSLQSTLGAPLLLEIPLAELNTLSAEQLKVSLADPLDYQRLGVERKPFHQQLNFKTIVGSDKAYISVSSRETATEPYVSFVMRVQWPEGSLIQRYTLLIDPAPAAKPTTARVVRKQDGTGTRFTSTVQTRKGDSLWHLARRVQRPQGSNIAQVMNALYRINHHAFVGGSADKLIAGVPIKTPSAAQIRAQARQFEAEALQQNDAAPATRQEAKAAAGGNADSRNLAAAAITPSSSKPSIVDPNMQDQLEGIKAGIAAAEAGKVRTNAHIAVLEHELSALVERYQVMSDKARDLEQQGERKPATGKSLRAASSSSDNGNSLLYFSGIMAGFAGAGYLLGQALATKKPGKNAALSKRSWLAGLLGNKAMGSNTYEQPFNRQVAETAVANDSLTTTGVSSNASDDKDTEDPGLVAAAYLAFGMQDEAQITLSEAILDYPERADLKMQLLEHYCNAAMHENFEGMAAAILSGSDDTAVSTRVDLLRMQMPDGDAIDESDAENLQRRAG